MLVELGASAVLHQIGIMQKHGGDFLSTLGFRLGDGALGYQVSLGVKEALKRLIPFDDRLLQVSCARVTVRYPQGGEDWSLRGIPAHQHLEKMLQDVSGGQVTVIPELADVAPKIYYHPPTPFFLRSSTFFHPPYRSYRTPFSPAQCLVPTAKAGSQRMEGLLVVVAVLPRDASTCVPCGDAALAERMTELVNERLARSGKGVTCSIAPLEMYGEAMDLGAPS